jgi:two-component system, NarL family, invasion response regulator UvrY
MKADPIQVKLAIVDDHKMFTEALAESLSQVEGIEVLFTAYHGKEFLKLCHSADTLPDVVLLDINMPFLDGYKTAEEMRTAFPAIRLLALSMNNSEESIMKMLKAGARGYVLKDSSHQELQRAIFNVMEHGYFHSDLVAGALLNLTQGKTNATQWDLSARESHFLSLACTDLTYKEIADKMCVAERTVDGYREALFVKFNVKSRTSLAVFAIRHGLVVL